MSLSDPQTITLATVLYSLPRILQNSNSQGTQVTTKYQTSDEALVISVSHTKTGGDRTRSQARFDWKKIVVDPLTQVNDFDSTSVYIVIDRPNYGFTADDVDNLVASFKTWLTTGASGMVRKLYGNES